MNENKKIKLNYLYNVIYQVFLLIVPLIVTPYVSRVLEPSGVGKYSFSYSLITYFTIVGALGFGYYAQREIAKAQNDKMRMSKLFWEINICRLIPVLFSLIVNVILCLLNVYGDYTNLMLIFNMNIIAIAFDIAFYFQGNENFLKLVSTSVIIKLLSIISIFIFVKTVNDLWIYALINSLLVIFSNLALWIGIHKYLTKVKFNELKPLRHLKGTIRLFIPTIATTIYTVLDKTLVGLLIKDTYVVTINGVEVIKKYSDLENGYYEQSEKLIKMAMTVITSLGTVMIPRNSNEFAKGNIDNLKKNIYTTSKVAFLIAIPMVFGFIAVSQNFVPWYFGEGYDKCIILLMIFSPLILIVGFSNIFGLQYMVPTGHDKMFTFALVAGALINLSLNFVFIPILWSYGAAIASIIGELCVTLIMGFMIRKEINMKKIIFSSWKYLISSLFMFGICFYVQTLLPSSIINTLLIILLGLVSYFIALLILKEELILSSIKKYIAIIKK